jgi:predicted amidophosphoribosyltransferase
MKQRIHRDKLMFQWFTKHHEIVVGFKRVRYGTCSQCGKSIPEGDSLCDVCFAQQKAVSKK